MVFIVFTAEGTECKTPTAVPAGDLFKTNSSSQQQSEVGNQVNLLHVFCREAMSQSKLEFSAISRTIQLYFCEKYLT